MNKYLRGFFKPPKMEHVKLAPVKKFEGRGNGGAT